MRRVLAAAVAELRELEAASGRLLVLRRRVIPRLALRALQCHDFAHLPILTDSGLGPRTEAPLPIFTRVMLRLRSFGRFAAGQAALRILALLR